MRWLVSIFETPSAYTRNDLLAVADLARSATPPIHLVMLRVVGMSSESGSSTANERVIQETIASLEQQGVVDASLAMTAPPDAVADAITAQAQEIGCDLLVLPRYTDFLLDALIRQSPIPVLLLIQTKTAAPPAHLLLVLDGSPIAEQALPTTIALARTWHGMIHLLHVVPASTGYLESDQASLQTAEQYLERVRQHLNRRDIRTSMTIACGSPAERIAALAQEIPADMIVLATERQDMGDVVHALVRRMQQMMLIVPAYTSAISIEER
jgi:nucleotide-binding universal stress UspA family protein